jgi:hypothetical protein
MIITSWLVCIIINYCYNIDIDMVYVYIISVIVAGIDLYMIYVCD